MEAKADAMKDELDDLRATSKGLTHAIQALKAGGEGGGTSVAQELSKQISGCEAKRRRSRLEVIRQEDNVSAMCEAAVGEARRIEAEIRSRSSEVERYREEEEEFRIGIDVQDARIRAMEALCREADAAQREVQALLEEERRVEEQRGVSRDRVEAMVKQGRMLQQEAGDCEGQARELKEGLRGAGISTAAAAGHKEHEALRQALEEKKAESAAADGLIRQLGLRLAGHHGGSGGGVGINAIMGQTATVAGTVGEAQAA